jgi:Domain of unknown function (DUF4034)
MLIRFSVSLASAPAALLVLALAWSLPHTSPAQAAAPALNLAQWERDLQADLIAEKFDSLDQTADRLRTEKTRVPGGQWQLRFFYEALDAPQQTEQDSVEHIGHLEHWMSQSPKSVTARVAMATSLVRWAWVARGRGFANTVTPEGWRLFKERIDKAQTILDGSQNMAVKCPQWYSAMLDIGIAQAWGRERMHQVLEEGIKLEPDYYYLYMEYANYLLPKWYGHAGDASSFALTSADELGGGAGDILYFRIGANLIRRVNSEFPAHEMDWQRLQSGYQALVSQYGSAGRSENQLAYMAWKFGDPAVAHQQFVIIGNNWNRDVWGDRNYFDRARDWAQSPTTALLPGQGQTQPPVIH